MQLNLFAVEATEDQNPMPSVPICRFCGSRMAGKGHVVWWCNSNPEHFFGRTDDFSGLWLGETDADMVAQQPLPVWALPIMELQQLQEAWIKSWKVAANV